MANTESSASKGLSQPRRVMLWTTPRTLTTVLCKCLSFVPGMRIFYEPYLAAHIFGPGRQPLNTSNKYDEQCLYHYSEERILKETPSLPEGATNWFSADVCTYDWVKSQLKNASDPDAQVIFCKEVAFAIAGHYDKIPDGFQHIFLIRNPYKVVLSHKRMCVGMILKENNLDTIDFQDIPQRLTGKTCGYSDLMELFSYIKQHQHDNPVVIDADDLQNHTSSILRQLLEDVIGVPFKNDFLSWEDNIDVSKKWVMAKGFGYNSIAAEGGHTKGFTSTCIEPAKEPPSRNSLTPDLIKVIDDAMPIYEELYKLKLKP